MAERHSKKPLLPFLALCCLLFLLPSASAVPMSRSLRSRNQPQPPSFKLTPQDMMQAAVRDLGGGGAAARMTVEVNDYPDPGANPRHNPPPPQGPPPRAPGPRPSMNK